MDISRLTTSILDVDFDRAISARFARKDKRRGLQLLSLFDHELAKIPHQTMDPLLRQIRRQFWRDALSGQDDRGHPLAEELISCFGSHPSMLDDLETIIEAHERYDGEVLSPTSALSATNEREASLFGLSCRYIDNDSCLSSPEFFKTCGQAYGGSRLLCQWYGNTHQTTDDVEEMLLQTQAAYTFLASHLIRIPPSLRAAFLPLALVPSYLNLFHASDRTISEPIDLNPVKKIWILWKAARNGFHEMQNV